MARRNSRSPRAKSYADRRATSPRAAWASASSATAPPAITGTTAVTATLTVNSTAKTMAALETHLPRSLAIGSSAALASLFFLLFPNRRKRLTMLFSLIALAAFIGTIVGCGGGSNASSQGNAGTTPGAYVLTITGTSGTISQTTQVNVSVD
jgi:hypothetical protein